MLKLIVFDWDDCIVQGSSDAYYASYTKAIRDNSIEIDSDFIEKQVRALWGRPHQTVIESLIGTDNPQLDKVVNSYEQIISSDFFSKHISLISGAKEILISLREQYILAIATGMNAIPLKEQLIPKMELQDIFSSIISSSELSDPSRGKPYPDMLLKLLGDFNVSPSETIMVGDAKSDVLMTQAANVTPIVVLTGQLNREAAELLGVKNIISSVADLPLLIRSLNW